MNRASTIEAFKKFSSLTILVIGDVILDTYRKGKVNRISPEAPVPILDVHTTESRLGGAANVALNIQGLEAQPILCSVIGTDEGGDKVQALLSEAKMSTDGIMRSADRITSVKTRLMSGSTQLMRMDEEQTEMLHSELAESFKNKVLHLIDSKKPDAIIFEDYDKGCLNADLIRTVIEKANNKNIPVAVDPKKRNFFNYKNASLFKPNMRELKDGLQLNTLSSSTEDLAHAFKVLNEVMPVKQAFFTLSEDGVFITDGQNKLYHPAHKRNIADVSGAGDTVISVATCALACGLDASSLAYVANLAGGYVCQFPGVKAITLDELKVEFEKSIQ